MNKKLREGILVSCVFSVVFCCFSVPIITFYTTTSDDAPKQSGIGIDIDDCPQQPEVNLVANIINL